MNKSKVIKHLERHSNRGDVAATFQLYDNYRKGKDVDFNDVLAEKYFIQCIDFLEAREKKDNIDYPLNKIYLDKLSLIDFRKFNKLDVSFDDKLTVFIGSNGAGKTSLANSIAKALGWISSGLEKEGKHSKPLLTHDVNIYSSHRSEVHSIIKIGKSTAYKSSLFKYIKGAADGIQNSYLDEFRALSDLYRVINDHQRKLKKSEINLPLFAFYSVERSHFKSNKSFDIEKLTDIKPSSRFDAYDGALDGAGKFGDFLEWFLILDNLANGTQDDQAVNLKNEIESLEDLVDDDSHPLWNLLVGKRKEYNSLSNTNQDQCFSKQLRAVKKAVIDIVPSVSELFVDRSSGRAELKVNNDGININIYQASQGQQVLVGLAADLARRLVMLNPNSDNPLQGQGIVIIDEIELHLHPKWQQMIIYNLQTTFPNIQFIITTHSPQVLSTVDKRCIRQFSTDEDRNDIVETPKFQTKGVKSADILARIMGTTAIPDIDEAHWVDDFSTQLFNGNRLDAELVLEKLIQHFDRDHPVITDCLNQIKIFEMKQRVKKIKEVKD